MAKKKENSENKPKVHPELDGLELTVNTFGEITANYDIDKINEFLNRKVDDKKLRNRKDKKSS
ncbi:hypothetical protein QNI19_34080 [Cytophagaceae bacterium DM2B3-1]|uniref:Uncharacterized protein n=2 Tax=Xanthocytophaga TaxID=3078918 RepID=A0AAE3QXA7_9BACT|nr:MULTISPECIES: hypothetical protein [Xanthocytophaga]MDJ1467441.1 hypothetical protein [Xanthocytophaga flavus]MDJ1484479.1 hypothetical protein [Xanthocytophaga flavus]MDJ1498021.1 hypothetical protein [Xanthocytophaga flavus]MDJ1499055.1 hypothetical protein [Xanthocytophaga agilis]